MGGGGVHSFMLLLDHRDGPSVLTVVLVVLIVPFAPHARAGNCAETKAGRVGPEEDNAKHLAVKLRKGQADDRYRRVGLRLAAPWCATALCAVC